jgi:hypothetical protein
MKRVHCSSPTDCAHLGRTTNLNLVAFLVFALAITFEIPAIAEDPWLVWTQPVREYQIYSPSVEAMATDTRGDVYFSGWTYIDRGYYVDWYARYDRNGQEQFFHEGRIGDGGYQSISPADMAVDGRTNMYIAGWTQADSRTTPPNGPAMYLKKAGGGDAGWFREAWGAPGSVYSFAVAVDSIGNSYVAGEFSGTPPNFWKTSLKNPIGSDNSLFSAGKADAFIVKYDADGTILWLKHAGGTEDDLADGIGFDRLGNCYVSGLLGGAGNFDALSVAPAGGFLAKYNPSGVAVWARNIDRGSMKVDTNGNCYITGAAGLAQYNSGGQLVWNVPAGSATDLSLSREHLFTIDGAKLRKYTQAGQLLWSFDIGSPHMAADPVGNAYCSDMFNFQTVVGGTAMASRWRSLYLARFAPDKLRLTIAHNGSRATLCWSTNAVGAVLTACTNLAGSSVWNRVTGTPTVQNGRYTMAPVATGKAKLYRLEAQ